MSTPPESDPTLFDEKKKLLAETRSDLLKRQLSNAENYDKAILSLSVAFLGFSLTFLKDFIPVHDAKWPIVLHASWWIFCAAIGLTIVSYLVSQTAVAEQLRRAERYYLRDDIKALERSCQARFTDWVNAASGICFILGVVLTTVFVTVNVEGASRMSSDNKTGKATLRRGAPVASIQQAPLERGAPIPDLQQPAQQSPPPKPPTSPPAPQSTPAQQQPAGGQSSEGKK